MKFSINPLISLSLAVSALLATSFSAFAGEQKLAQTFNGNQKTSTKGENYIGLGTVIGGDSDFIDAAIISKVKLLNLGRSKTLSIRPSAVFSNGDLDLRIPATIDITKVDRDLGELNGKIKPYAGGGIAIDSGGDTDLMLTGGMDVKLTSKLTATTAANVLFLGDTEFDLTVGLGYNF